MAITEIRYRMYLTTRKHDPDLYGEERPFLYPHRLFMSVWTRAVCWNSVAWDAPARIKPAPVFQLPYVVSTLAVGTSLERNSTIITLSKRPGERPKQST